jgi:hydrogenase-1 operon protein HyaE
MTEVIEFSVQRATEINNNFNLLLERIQANSHVELLDETGFQRFVEAQGDGMVLFTQEPDQQPETWDVAVILPEVLKMYPRLRASILPPELARQFKSRYGIARWPSLIFVRDGGYVGAIEGMRDWDEYQHEIAEMLKKPIGRAPSIGIPVVSQGGESSSCH